MQQMHAPMYPQLQSSQQQHHQQQQVEHKRKVASEQTSTTQQPPVTQQQQQQQQQQPARPALRDKDVKTEKLASPQAAGAGKATEAAVGASAETEEQPGSPGFA